MPVAVCKPYTPGLPVNFDKIRLCDNTDAAFILD